MKTHVAELLGQALAHLQATDVLPKDIFPAGGAAQIQVEHTRDKTHGDLASNIAMTLAKPARRAPREIAELIIGALPQSPRVSKVTLAGPGFINFFLSGAAQSAIVADILQAGAAFGSNREGAGRKVQVEFVSANPTGPLHVGHGRGAAVGDSMCRLLDASGWEVTREFYYNDAGVQIGNLGLSVQSRCRGLGPDDADWPAEGYRGDYIRDVADAYMAGETVHADDRHITGAADEDNLDAIRDFAVAYLRREQDMDLRAFDVHFDVYFLESSLYTEGKVEETVQRLIASGHTYEEGGALWLRTTAFGDDKDRVMRKKDGTYTYFVPDIAYHTNKWQRGFQRVVNEQGGDHHGTVARVRAGLQALDIGIPQGWPDYVLHQMVTVMRGGEEVKLSKRAGSYVTLRDLIDEVGRDATRYFLVARSADSQLTFDIDLARAQTNDNPVYYIQYAHARVCSVLRQATEKDLAWNTENGLASLDRLDSEYELGLMGLLARYPETVAKAAKLLEPHLIAQYLRDVAAALHTWYHAQHFVVDDAPVRDARLALAVATRQVLRNGLALLGVSAPEEM